MEFHARSVGTAWSSTIGKHTGGMYTRYFELLLTAGLWEILLLALVIFAILVRYLILFMENFFPDIKDDPTFPTLMQGLAVLPSFAYFGFVNSNINSYTRPVEIYYDFLQHLRDLAETLADAGLTLLEPEIAYLVDLGDRCYRDPTVPQVTNPVAPPKLREELARIENFESLPRPKQFLYALSATISRATRECEEKFLLPPILAHKCQLAKDIQDIERASRISPPIVDNVWITSLVILFFVVWEPIRMWSLTGPFHTQWFSPIVLTVLLMPLIHNKWLGNLWDDSRPWTAANHEDWPKQFKRDIETVFNFKRGGKDNLRSGKSPVPVDLEEGNMPALTLPTRQRRRAEV